MKKIHLGICALSALLCSCDEGEQPEKSAAIKPESPSAADLAREELFGAWMSKARLRFQMEQPEFAGKFYSQIEGRLQGNANQFRAITEEFDTEKLREWTAIWGATEEELFAQEIVLLRDGFERHQAQTFTDTSGKALHQLVMLCSHDAIPLVSSPIAGFRPPEHDPLVPNLDGLAFDVVEIEEAPLEEVEEIVVEETEVPEVTEPAPAPTEPEVAEVVEEEPEPELETIDYKVVPGDTLSSIARRHKVTIAAIKKANNLSSDVIRPRQILKIPKGS